MLLNMFEHSSWGFCIVHLELDANHQPIDWTYLYCNDYFAKLENKSKEELKASVFMTYFRMQNENIQQRFIVQPMEKKLLNTMKSLKSLATIFMSAAFRQIKKACLRVFYRTSNKMNWIKRKSIRNLKRLCESFDRKMNYGKCLVETMSQSIKLM